MPSPRSPLIISALIVALAILAAPLLHFWAFPGVGEEHEGAASSYQAVFIGKGDLVYYGHLRHMNRTVAELTDAYYLRQNQPTVDPATGQSVPPANALDLVKYGSMEVYKPEDTLYIPTSQILYWTNLTAKSPVIEAINRDKAAAATAPAASTPAPATPAPAKAQ